MVVYISGAIWGGGEGIITPKKNEYDIFTSLHYLLLWHTPLEIVRHPPQE